MKDLDDSNPELKRLNSVKQKIKNYQKQQLAIKVALHNTDQRLNTKIIFDENGTTNDTETEHSKKRKRLFDESDSDEEYNYNFEDKKQFTGRDGEKLLQLQTKYKGDKRFALDERFIEKELDNETTPVEEDSLEEEKKVEMGILEEVLGNKLKKRASNERNNVMSKKKMLRYDPNLPDHSKFEAQVPAIPKKEKKKQKEEEKSEEVQPQVSKDVFYKVSDDLKDVFQEPQNFSLLNLFGQKDEREEDNVDQYAEEKIIKKVPLDRNPFKYDSSDDDREEEVNNTGRNELVKESTSSDQQNDTNFWGNQFFFKEDDYRFQEGADFVLRTAGEQKTKFEVQRRNLKQLVKTKVRNIQKKKNPFKKKLGGNKNKKLLRIKKAMKK